AGLIMAEAVATALIPTIGRAAAEAAVARACNRALERSSSLGAALRDDPELQPLLSDAEIERITDPIAYLGSAGAFVDRVVARIDAIV
ncbi:MAG TPA: 3-carboxy-cis,cis-muconate cycloisomerase, partial [Methylomirabilota bacterium]|nr:3-carboxy-cis,cis-muconate cycloisomerase [Methylomirabilota bacterium]